MVLSGGVIAFSSVAFSLGVLHAFDIDHVMAVSGLAETSSRSRKMLGICCRWAMGHGLTLLLVGVCVLSLGVSNLDGLSHLGEKLVGFMLMGIGLWGLWGLISQDQIKFTAKVSLDAIHKKSSDETKGISARDEPRCQHGAVLVGMIHGLAGSAPLIGLMPIGNFDSPWLGLGYIAIFSFGALISMLIFGGLLGVLFHGLNQRAVSFVIGLRIMILTATFCLGAHWVYANS
ncbi:MAG: hypothetical protein QGG38_08845 [Nitrospinaceae bacterium]|nr:hypothetical protein [Nitrospinaceae bacterium]MDP6712767.1 hypothetical protein [Nitrospinaceae bacterium]